MISQYRESETVGSARDGNGDKGRGFEKSEPLEPFGELGETKRRRRCNWVL